MFVKQTGTLQVLQRDLHPSLVVAVCSVRPDTTRHSTTTSTTPSCASDGYMQMSGEEGVVDE